MSVTAREAVGRAREILDYHDAAYETVANLPYGPRLLRALLANPFMSTARAVAVLGVTPPTARKAVDTLRHAGVVEEAGKRGRATLVVARRLLELFERPME